MKQYFWRGEETVSLLGLGQMSHSANWLHQSTFTKILQTLRPGQNHLLWLKQEWHLEIKSGLRQSTRHQDLSLFIRILSQRLSCPTVLIQSRAAVPSVHHKFLGAKPELELRTGTITGHVAGLWGQFLSSPVRKRESDGLQVGSLAVASGEFHDCIRRPCTRAGRQEGVCGIYLVFFFINYNSSDICRRRACRKRNISHLITVPDFAAAFTHLS